MWCRYFFSVLVCTCMCMCVFWCCSDGSPTRAVANIVGNINGQQFGVSRISANIDRVDSGNRLIANLTDAPPTISMILIDSVVFTSFTCAQNWQVVQLMCRANITNIIIANCQKKTTLVSIGGEIREAVIGGNYWPEWPAHVVGLVAHPLFKPSVKHHVLAVAAYEN